MIIVDPGANRDEHMSTGYIVVFHLLHVLFQMYDVETEPTGYVELYMLEEMLSTLLPDERMEPCIRQILESKLTSFDMAWIVADIAVRMGRKKGEREDLLWQKAYEIAFEACNNEDVATVCADAAAARTTLPFIS